MSRALASRLDAPSQIPREGEDRRSGTETQVGRQGRCSECGAPVTFTSLHEAFCRAGCRKAFNNRRATRGAELYDVVMALRYDRAKATELKAWAVLCRLASQYRAEDLEKRDGRASWRPLRAVMSRRPWIFANVVSTGIRKKR